MYKLKIYTEVDIIPNGVPHTFMLIPFLGTYAEATTDPDAGRFNDLKERGKELFELVNDPGVCDYFLLPFGYSFNKDQNSIIVDLLKKANEYGKRTLVFYNADDDSRIKHENIILFRTSFYSSTKNSSEYALPGWSLDFRNYMKDGKMFYLQKEEEPSVSYCGYIDHIHDSLFWKIKRALNAKTDHESRAKATRGKAVRTLSNNKKIKCDFLIRNGFWAAGINDKIKARKEYASNMINSIYTIVTRGGGNFSYRLYEALSCGRIPLFINTDSVLPFENDIKWKDHMVCLDVKDCDKIDEILLDFHRNIEPEKLMEIQKSNRKIYEDHISPFGFFKHLQCKLVNKEI